MEGQKEQRGEDISCRGNRYLVIVHYKRPCIYHISGTYLVACKMAELPSSAEKALQKLKEQLTCPVCLEHYKNPKLLQCFHVFCEGCLQALLARNSQQQQVDCPNCRQPTPLPENGVPGLRGAFLVHHLFDIHDTLEKVSAPAKAQCQKCKKRESSCYCRTCKFICEKCKDVHLEWEDFASHEIISLEQLTTNVMNHVSPAKKELPCPSHPEKQVDLYCETCEEMICRDCIVRVHRDHQYDLVRAAFPKHRLEIEASLEPVQAQLASVNKALEGLDILCTTINDQRQSLKTKVQSTIRQIHQALEKREEELVSEIDQMANQKLKTTAAQRDQLELVATRLSSCREFVQESLQTGSQEEVLAIKKNVVHQIKEMTGEFKPDMLAAEERANMKFYDNGRKELLQTCHQFGKVVALYTDPVKCVAEGKGLHIAVLGEEATATIHLRSSEGESCKKAVNIRCKLVSKDGSTRVRGKAKQNGDKCTISYQAQCSGQHQLYVQVEGENIAGSPFNISAFLTTATETIEGLKHPWGVAVTSQGQVVISESQGNCITVVDKNGGKTSFGSKGSGPGKLHSPAYVACISSEELIVCNYHGKTIQKYSLDGRSVAHVEARGDGAVQPFQPMGIAVHPNTNKVYVSDHSNNLIQIFNPDLTHSGSFGGTGSGNGQFSSPNGISFDSTGNLFVADESNKRVQVFTAAGECIYQFNGGVKLKEPVGIALDANDIVYISELDSHCISVFTRDGQYLTSFGSQGSGPEQFNQPIGIAIGHEGKIYIADNNNGSAQVF